MDESVRVLETALERIARRMDEEEDYLVQLDSDIGDADHGTNVARGFSKAAEEFDPDEDTEIADAVEKIGLNLISEVGGASGALYGSTITTASEELETGLGRETAVAFAERYLESLQERGDTEIGQKTMVDATAPAVHTFKKAVEVDDCDAVEALERAVEACRAGVEFTTHIRATQGRASYLQWRSVDHQDPGATSTLYILEELYRAVETRTAGGARDDDGSS